MELKAGYKQTEVGVMPTEWRWDHLGNQMAEMTDYVAAGSFESLRNNVCVYDGPNYALYVRLFDLRLGLGHTAQKYVDEASYRFLRKSNLFGNEILVANIGANVGEAFLMPLGFGRATLAPNMILVRSDETKLRSDFLYYYIRSDIGQSEVRELIAGSGHPKVNKTDLKKLRVVVPPRVEQEAIAEALSDADALIESLEQLIAKKRQIKQGAMQDLLTGKKRLPGFNDEWKETRIADLVTYERPDRYMVKSAIYSEHGDVPVLTANKSFILGFTDESFGVCSDVPAIVFDDFTVASKYANFPFKVKSSAIKLLRPRHGQVNLRFVFDRLQLVRFPLGDHKRYYISEYQHTVLMAPSYEEQCAIAEVLSDMSLEVEELEATVARHRNIKQGMMQELLTGRIRLV